MFRPSISSWCKLTQTYFSPRLLNEANTRIINRAVLPRQTCVRFFTNKELEGITEDEEIIYRGPLSKQLMAVKVFSLGSSGFGLVSQPILISKASELGSTPVIVAFAGILGFFTFVTPLLLHFITKKYAVRITYNEKTKKYVITTVSFFMRERQVEFTPDDVVVPDILGMFTTCHIKGVPYFFEPKQFHDPTYYVKIMGYDKPIDFKFSEAMDDDSGTKKSEAKSAQNKNN